MMKCVQEIILLFFSIPSSLTLCRIDSYLTSLYPSLIGQSVACFHLATAVGWEQGF